MFDSTRHHNEPAEMALRHAIPAFAELLPQMRVGEVQRLWVPEALSFQGRAGVPRGDLVFDLQLVEVERGTRPPQAPPDLLAPPAGARASQTGLGYRIIRRRGFGASSTTARR